MAGEWIKMRADLHDDPAVFRMASMLGIDKYAVIGRLHTFWSWIDRHSVDGHVDGATSTYVDEVVRLEGFAASLEKVGWLQIDENGISVPKFDRHNGESAKKRALKTERQARWRAGKDGDVDGSVDDDVDAQTSTKGSTREEKRREEKKKQKHMSGEPDSASTIIEYLNEKSGRSYKNVKANTDLVKARIKEGATVDELKAVIDGKVKAWGSDPKMSEYLRPSTLFRAQNFAQYAGQLNGHREVNRDRDENGIRFDN